MDRWLSSISKEYVLEITGTLPSKFEIFCSYISKLPRRVFPSRLLLFISQEGCIFYMECCRIIPLIFSYFQQKFPGIYLFIIFFYSVVQEQTLSSLFRECKIAMRNERLRLRPEILFCWRDIPVAAYNLKHRRNAYWNSICSNVEFR